MPFSTNSSLGDSVSYVSNGRRVSIREAHQGKQEVVPATYQLQSGHAYVSLWLSQLAKQLTLTLPLLGQT